ncbi:MAG: FHA domain-containing protein [Anaerolineae bacterium]|nr:FHA domain-containing protein [Anaerolineae bacterium]
MFGTFPLALVLLLGVVLIILITAWILLFALGGRKPKSSQQPTPDQAQPDLSPPPTQENIYTPTPKTDTVPQQTAPTGSSPPATEPKPTIDFGLHFILADGNDLTIPKLPATIGRAAGCDIRLDDDSISNQHARMDYDHQLESITIEDLGSSNGTQVNGRPTRKNILHHDDQVTFGSVTVTFLDTGFLPPIA